jgi:four helix bundle protein
MKKFGENKKPFDLEERTVEFAKGIIRLCKRIPKDVISVRIIGQLVRSSGSVGANYREATEAVSKKDFIHRMKITRKECKETSYWLELLKEVGPDHIEDIESFWAESRELRNIFTAIINKES